MATADSTPGEDTQVMKGTSAVAKGVAAIDPDVISAYPITPQTGVVEKLSEIVADGDIDSEFIKVDSEFNAASTCIGASAAGARAFSATSSQGLKLMSEPLFTAAGHRLPIVMAVANRSLSGPLSIWADHTDCFAERDGGMMQFHAEDVQEAIDHVLLSFKVAEQVNLPALSNFDGFILTHVQEPANIPTEAEVSEFLPPRDPAYTLDPSDPATMGAYARPEHWTEARYEVQAALEDARDVWTDAVEEFDDVFGRDYTEYDGMIDTYRADDAETVIVALGSICGTIRGVIDEMRADGELVGLVRPRVHRPFPAEQLRDALSGAHQVAVLTKENSQGFESALASEIKSALYHAEHQPPMKTYILGMAGRDVTSEDIKAIVADAETATDVMDFSESESWPQLREDIISGGI
ncbi:pyruvate ferredoxin oxidoreductase [Halococcoides cellulosivorans]|uniref:Pyruvate ferredoxin oxidoreductase n=1 Tax=Halococcoides cellulosivorans TaxID=1679096 RepID=A0A2R4WZZ3_9EURY|nr:pyruvate ferredoxin oxidoreductase [Halococcoides cellulosivorans]AWB27097.1 pyruvate ferredoxin oxidoreductase [Halococcoides cellulosivorans]